MKRRDSYIDFIKGFCIIFVVLNHTMLSKFWLAVLSSCVPMFLCIQVMHVKECANPISYISNVNKIKKVLLKIVLPFVIIVLITGLIYYYVKPEYLNDFILSGGGTCWFVLCVCLHSILFFNSVVFYC